MKKSSEISGCPQCPHYSYAHGPGRPCKGLDAAGDECDCEYSFQPALKWAHRADDFTKEPSMTSTTKRGMNRFHKLLVDLNIETLDTLSLEDRKYLLMLINSAVSRIAVRFNGDE